MNYELCHARPCCVHPTPILLWQELGAPPVARTVIKASVSSELSLATATARAWSNVQCARIDGKLWKMMENAIVLWQKSLEPMSYFFYLCYPFGSFWIQKSSYLFYPFLNFRSIHAIIDALLPCVARSSASATQLALRIRAPLSPRARTRQIARFAQLEPGSAAKLCQNGTNVQVQKRQTVSASTSCTCLEFSLKRQGSIQLSR